jgi:cation diffusion facilitator CzcD-associated flavoprotein CzcO/acetyl esterase/lipase
MVNALTDAAAAGRHTYDVVVVGAGFSGLYALKQARYRGITALALEAGDDVGGTWYWNRYPGARCDVATLDYTYVFDPELEDAWTWSEKYARQPEIERYLRFVADRYDLRRDIRFGTRLTAASWDDAADHWHLTTDGDAAFACRYLVLATGPLSVTKVPDLPGLDTFAGELYYTGRWPAEPVSFTGKRVAVLGTGSSGIQVIPEVAKEACELTVLQRTPSYTLPAKVDLPISNRKAWLESDRTGYRRAAKLASGGVPVPLPTERSFELTDEEIRERFDKAWEAGELYTLMGIFSDLLSNRGANDKIASLIHEKIRSIVHGPETAEALIPRDYAFATRRPCLDSGFYETFNLPHVKLVDLRKRPLDEVTERGIKVGEEILEFDAIVLATGFDAMTGAIMAIDIVGQDGKTLKGAWTYGPVSYLGLMTAGFPNLFSVVGPGSPSVLSNMAMSIQQQVEWIAETVDRLRADGFTSIEPTTGAQAAWVQHVDDCAAITLYPTADSWYVGANIPGKPRVFMPYVGGSGNYRRICDEVRERGYLGFIRRGPDGTTVNDGVIRRLQPDMAGVLEAAEALDMPALETLTPAEARAQVLASTIGRPPGPEVGDIADGVFPGPVSDIAYRVYRPDDKGDDRPLVLYFHGGGWMFGGADSNDPFLRDMCVRSGAVVVSADYRHAPEAKFPAAVDDAFAALRWVSDNAELLGAAPDKLIVAGWSAGGNLAAVVSQLSRECGGPKIQGQVLITPVTDCDLSRASYTENGDGYFLLSTATMKWFWDNYADEEQRLDPRASPLRAADLSGLPPALVVTAEFDPLRDEGAAYAAVLDAAGVSVDHIQQRGLTHAALTMVDVILSAAPIRQQVADWIQARFAAA